MYECCSCGKALDEEKNEVLHCEKCGVEICEECFKKFEGLCNCCYMDWEL